jgi:cell division protein FtsL
MSRFKLCLLFCILTLLSTLSSTTHSNNGTRRNGERARTREQLRTEYERMTFRRRASTSGRSSLSSLLSTISSLLVNSSSSQSAMSSVVTHDTYRRRRHEHDNRFHFDFIASQASPTQGTLHSFQHSSNVFRQNFTFVNENLQIQLDYQSMTPVDEVDDFPFKDRFALLDHGVLHTKLHIGILYERGKFLFYYF